MSPRATPGTIRRSRPGTGAWSRRISVFIGIVNAAGTFLPVFLLRLGASANDVGLLTALPALTAFLLAIPFGRMLQARGRIVAWYSRLRLVAWASYAVIAGAVAVLPRSRRCPSRC